jgi:hypothetical protein
MSLSCARPLLLLAEQELWDPFLTASRPPEQQSSVAKEQGSSVAQGPGQREEESTAVAHPPSPSTNSGSSISAASRDRSPSNMKGWLIEERGLQMRRAMEKQEAWQIVEGLLSRKEFQDTGEREEQTDEISAELTFDDVIDSWAVRQPFCPTLRAHSSSICPYGALSANTSL